MILKQQIALAIFTAMLLFFGCLARMACTIPQEPPRPGCVITLG